MTEPKEERLSSAASELTKVVDDLRKSIEEANYVKRDLDLLSMKSKSNSRIITAVASLAVVNLLIVAAVAVFGIRLAEVVSVQHDSALCPLYELFINSDTPEARERARQRGDNLEDRAKAFEIIRDSYRALNC